MIQRFFTRRPSQSADDSDSPATETAAQQHAIADVDLATDKARAYANGYDHLRDELRWLNRLLAAHVLRLRQANFYDSLKDFRRFFIADEQIDAILAQEVFEHDQPNAAHAAKIAQLMAQASALSAHISRQVEIAQGNGILLPLARLCRSFQLSEFERHVLIICLAPRVDARYEKLYAYLQNDITKKHASVDLVLSLLDQNLEDRLESLGYFEATAPLRHYRLLELKENGSPISTNSQTLAIDNRVLSYLLGAQPHDEVLAECLHFCPPLHWNAVIIDPALQQRLQSLLRKFSEESSERWPLLFLCGRGGTGKKTIAQALYANIGMTVTVVDIRRLLQNPDRFIDQVRRILREGILQSCALYFDHFETFSSNDQAAFLLSSFATELNDWNCLTVIGSTEPLPGELLESLPVFAIEVPAPDADAQEALWRINLEERTGSGPAIDLKQLVSSFDLTGGQIARAAHLAKQSAIVRNPEGGEMTLADILMACRAQSQPQLSNLARKITPKFRWNDLVLPDDRMRQLHELANQVKHKHEVLGQWGFTAKLALGSGLTALFAGPSGTGKTMAAEVIANALQLDLYKVDLSAVVSKYIGETEKNLNRIFAEAEHSNAILFFDEADALFGKRSEVRDSHDRYANIEIAYLLQKMEEYQGITILATNLRQNLDEAFIRRIRFIIEFPFPDETYRLRIWRGIWPAQTPLATDVDLPLMARQFKLAGGNIRNIALAAAFLAVENGRLVTMKHLLQATKREFQKVGKPLRDDELAISHDLVK